MTQEERIAQLEQENAELQAQLAEARQQISQLADQLHQVQGQLAKDSHNSSKPPSSDGLRRQRRNQRRRGEKPSGGQPGHAGHALLQVSHPDEVVCHRPLVCTQCQQSLEGVAGQIKERRQVQDVPEIGLRVREHQVEEVCCPACQHMSRGTFPAGVEAPAQYGPQLRALAVYLHEYQLVPLGRVRELLADLYGCEVSEGTLLTWIQWAAEQLAPTVARIADWLHVNSTRFLTHLAWHRRRGCKALEDIGIWPRFHGRAMRDRWASYDAYDCAQNICGAHLVRDCVYVAEQEQQNWAAEMADLLVSMAEAADEWRARGAAAVPAEERDGWIAQYFDLLASGFAAQPLPSPEDVPKRGGRRKQSAAKNLLDDLLRQAEQVLAFLDDLSIPFTNNQAERDLRMVKVQQKIAGPFRSENGATAFCRIRSYLSTMRKQGHAMLAALAAVFAGHPLPIAWAPM
jgi:transposase/uncharacterized coiled-coil protein SlyX